MDALDGSFSQGSHTINNLINGNNNTQTARRKAAQYQVKATFISQTNLRMERQNQFASGLMMGTLKAMLKNSVTEFFDNW